MSTAEQNIDYSLIPTIEVARQLFGQESRERTQGDERPLSISRRSPIVKLQSARSWPHRHSG